MLLGLVQDALSNRVHQCLRTLDAVLADVRLQVLSPSQLKGGSDLRRLCQSHSPDCRRLFDGCAAHRPQVPEPGDKLLGYGDRRFAGDAPADKQGEQFLTGEGLRSQAS